MRHSLEQEPLPSMARASAVTPTSANGLGCDAALADGWVLRPNRAFAGQTPLARMTAGDVTDLAAVRAYVDAARSPWS